MPHSPSPSLEHRSGRTTTKCVFTVDVEDWFHFLDIPSVPDISRWDSLPSRVEDNFKKLLDIFDRHEVRVTCFFLGYIARRFPGLVKEACARGHEIASHGDAHRLVYEMTARELLDDVVRAKRLLEDLIGRPVPGYRSPGFSLTEATPWFFDVLIEAGHRYDSSVFPARRGHGGLKTRRYAPYLVETESGGIIEFPMSVATVLGKPFCFFGGGYLRLFPYALVKAMSRKVLKQGRPVIFYVHPREIDPDHPRLPMNFRRRFKSYVNLETTEAKIRRILQDFEIVTFEHQIHSSPALREV